MDGPESFIPSEGPVGVSEQLGEEARQRFAAAAAALQQIAKEEKKARKRDDGVAQAILQFLTDTQRTHLATLISRLVARDCPSPFILAILSLVSADCRTIVADYLKEHLQGQEEQIEQSQHAVIAEGSLDTDANRELVDWVTRLELVLASNPTGILAALLVADGNIDGTVLQLSTFVLQEFLQSHGKTAEFERLQPVAAGILQSVFVHYLDRHGEELGEGQQETEQA